MNFYNGFSPGQRMKLLRWEMAEEAAGRRERPTACAACGQTEGVIDSHAEDYSEPFGDKPGNFGLCYVCHMMVHCRHHDRARWDRYRQIIREGYRAPAPQGRNWGAVKAILSGQEPLWLPLNPARERTVLDDIDEGKFWRANDQEDRGPVE